MRKLLIIVGVFSGVLVIGSLVMGSVGAFSSMSGFNQDQYTYYNDGYMMESFDDEHSYEEEYMHLSLEDRAMVEELFAEAVMNANLASMTNEKAIETIHTIKEDILENHIDETTYGYYGMMGRGMMGRSYSNYDSYETCGDSEMLDNLYEWYYLHSSEEDRLVIDQLFTEKLQNIVFDDYSVEEVVELISIAKQETINELFMTNNS